MPPSLSGSFHGQRPGLQASLAKRAYSGRRRARRHLHHPRHAVRELHPPADYPLDATLTGVGALLMLMMFRFDFSVIALIGVILLIGIVKKKWHS